MALIEGMEALARTVARSRARDETPRLMWGQVAAAGPPAQVVLDGDQSSEPRPVSGSAVGLVAAGQRVLLARQGRRLWIVNAPAAYANSMHFRHLPAPAGHESRVILGSEHNAISAASGDAVILGGGRAGMENVIGGKEDDDRQNQTTNLPVNDAIVADYAAILYGYNNVVNALASAAGGMHNLIRAAADHAIIHAHTSDIKAGGSPMILGGRQHIIDNPGGTDAYIGGGQGHTVTSSYGTAIGGRGHVVSGLRASALGGWFNTADQQHSTALGAYSRPAMPGGVATADGRFAATGDAQAETSVVRGETAGTSPAVITVPVGTHRGWTYTLHVIARTTVGAVMRSWKAEGGLQRGSGAVSLMGPLSFKDLGGSSGATAWSIGAAAGATGLDITVAGATGQTVRWVIRVDVVQTRLDV